MVLKKKIYNMAGKLTNCNIAATKKQTI